MDNIFDNCDDKKVILCVYATFSGQKKCNNIEAFLQSELLDIIKNHKKTGAYGLIRSVPNATQVINLFNVLMRKFYIKENSYNLYLKDMVTIINKILKKDSDLVEYIFNNLENFNRDKEEDDSFSPVLFDCNSEYNIIINNYKETNIFNITRSKSIVNLLKDIKNVEITYKYSKQFKTLKSINDF